MDNPGGPGGGLKVTTDVRDGATVAPGQDIGVKLTWDPKAWSGQDLDAALACVAVKGGLDPDLSGGEQPTANDGVYSYTLHVPDNIRPGCDICLQGFLNGTGADGGPQEATGERPCFMSGEPGPPSTSPSEYPPARPPSPPATRPPAQAPTTPASGPARVPAEVAGVQASQPAPAPLTPAPAAAPALAGNAELPRTGSVFTHLATAGGGLTLTLGGLSVMGGAGRRRTRRPSRS